MHKKGFRSEEQTEKLVEFFKDLNFFSKILAQNGDYVLRQVISSLGYLEMDD